MIAIHAYAIGDTAMLSLVLVENFSRFHFQEKHNAFVKSYVGGWVYRATVPKQIYELFLLGVTEISIYFLIKLKTSIIK